MTTSLAGGRRIALVCALFALALITAPTNASALTIGAANQQSCTAKHRAGERGVATQSWRAPADGAVQFRLGGTAKDDWDLALFEAGSGRRIDASQAWGANEVVQSVVRKGTTLFVQACRISGHTANIALTTHFTKAALTTQAPSASIVTIPLKERDDFIELEALGLNMNEVPNGNKAIAVISSEQQLEQITAAGFTYETIIPNAAAQERRYRAKEQVSAAQDEPSALPSGRKEYRQYTDIQAELKKIVDQHPKLAKPVTLPKKTYQGRDITGIEVTENVGANDDGKPIFFLMGVHHAREWPSAEIPLEFGLYLTDGFGKDQRITDLLKRVRVVIVPVINIDGYLASRGAIDPADNSGDPGGLLSTAEIVAPPGGLLAYRRKNCHGFDNSPSTPCELTHGVDPNRNYGQYWGGPGAGTDPNSQTYRGSDQWSEPETQAVHEYSQTHNVTSLITMHNYGSLVLRPPGLSTGGLAPDEDALKEIGDKMADAGGYISQFSYQLYDTTGTTEDWNYAAAGTFGYTIEMGPASDKGGNFHIEFKRAVIAQWTGEETTKGKGKGLREALLIGAEAGGDRRHFSRLVGTAPPDSVLRLRKDFDTPTHDPICAFETTAVSCPGGFEPGHAQKDFLDYTTVVPPNGRFDWLVTPSTRPFELKAGKTEQWTMTCENPVTKKVEETRKITVDRGQRLPLNFTCGAKPGTVTSRGCVDRRKLTLKVNKPSKQRLTRISVFVNDKRARTLKGKAARKARFTLRNLKPKRGRYKVVVVVYGSKGYKRVTTRVYRGCKKGRVRTDVDRRGGRR